MVTKLNELHSSIFIIHDVTRTQIKTITLKMRFRKRRNLRSSIDNETHKSWTCGKNRFDFICYNPFGIPYRISFTRWNMKRRMKKHHTLLKQNIMEAEVITNKWKTKKQKYMQFLYLSRGIGHGAWASACKCLNVD